MEGDIANSRMTRRDWGRGLMLLGAILLLLTAFLYIMAGLNQEQYGLFSGEWHLRFYTVLGIALMAGGAVLTRGASQKEG